MKNGELFFFLNTNCQVVCVCLLGLCAVGLRWTRQGYCASLPQGTTGGARQIQRMRAAYVEHRAVRWLDLPKGPLQGVQACWGSPSGLGRLEIW